MIEQKKVTVVTLKKMKKERRRIVALTAYDYFTSRLLNEAGVDLILIGDSLGMVVLGYENNGIFAFGLKKRRFRSIDIIE